MKPTETHKQIVFIECQGDAIKKALTRLMDTCLQHHDACPYEVRNAIKRAQDTILATKELNNCDILTNEEIRTREQIGAFTAVPDTGD